MKFLFNMWVVSIATTLAVSLYFGLKFHSLLKGMLGGLFFFFVAVLPFVVAVAVQRRRTTQD